MTGKDTDLTDLQDRNVHMLPRLPVFSGDAKDTPFDLWHFEVECLQAEKHSEGDIKLAIRRSLRGQASRSLMSLGIKASVSEILEKFRTIFGPSESTSSVLSTFYSLRQKEGEDAGAFSNRLIDCLHQATQLGRVAPEDTPTMLREAFEAGLRRETRLAVGFLFEKADLQFEKLAKEVKRKERELSLNTASVRSMQDSRIEQLTAQVSQLRTELQVLKQARPQQSPVPQARPRPNRPVGRGGVGHTPAPRFFAPRMPSSQQVRAQGTSEQRGAAIYQRPSGGHGDPITCWRCGQVGHVSRGCRNRGNPLNLYPPAASANPQAKQIPHWWGGQL